ncbi:hypothetical protein GCM10009817_09540 [Terrabacter lapilli]|uniref:RNA polymerase ECF family sigma subunit n=1 Tax=Terrabacter lapilli TaxID=436231 RepID=A0ABN2RMH3_9MICO
MGENTHGEVPRRDVDIDRRAAFEALFAGTHLALLAYAVRRVAEPSDAADVVADAFLVAWRRIDEAPTGADARPWMFGVARGCLSNYYRGQRRRSALADRLRQALTETPPLEDASTQAIAIRQALARLSSSDRELVQLEAWESLSRAEIAVALGCSQATVRVRLHRARARLRQALSEPEPDAGTPSNGRPSAASRPALQLVPASGTTRRLGSRPTTTTEEDSCVQN